MSGDDGGPATLEPDALDGRAGARVGWAFWTKAAPAFVLAAVLLLVIPLDRTGDTPPVRLLLMAGLGVAAVMTIAVWLAVRFDLGLGVQVATYAAAFNLLVIAAKLVLGPYAVYAVNQVVPLEGMVTIADPVGAAGAAVLVFALYALVLWFLFLLSRQRLPARLRPRRASSRRRLVSGLQRRWPVLLLLSPLLGIGVTVLLYAGLLAAGLGLQYLTFVFTSGVSLAVAVTLAVAVLLAGRAFRTAERRAVALGDAAVLTSLFWVCLGFLALYQVLWVVFVLALTSVWPLKVVTPK